MAVLTYRDLAPSAISFHVRTRRPTRITVATKTIANERSTTGWMIRSTISRNVGSRSSSSDATEASTKGSSGFLVRVVEPSSLDPGAGADTVVDISASRTASRDSNIPPIEPRYPNNRQAAYRPGDRKGGKWEGLMRIPARKDPRIWHAGHERVEREKRHRNSPRNDPSSRNH